MRKRFIGLKMGLALVSLVSVSGILAQQPRNRGPQKAAPAADLRVKYKTTTAGQSAASVTMIKGARERSEMRSGYGMDNVSITQCDLKRTIQLNDKTKKYVVTPMEVGNSGGAAGSNNTVATSPSEPSRRGGVLTYVTTVNDTGERKEMFGFAARHVKSSMTMESSPDACNPVKQRTETDGWYIDLAFGLDCQLGRQQMARYQVPHGGCQDRVNFKQLGTGKTGYPLIETMTMYGPDGQAMFTTTKEVVELSREPLDAALFDVPAGYTEAANAQELSGAPSMDEILAQATKGGQSADSTSDATSPAGVEAKQPGKLRVGVVTFNNKTDRSVSLDSLRERLVSAIESSGIDAVTLNATSQAEAEVEAQARQCDFILFTDISSLKTSGAKKIGGFLGKAAGVSGIDKSEARVDFRLVAVGETSPRLQSSATAKEEGDEASVGTTLDIEARMVSAEVIKKERS